MPVDRHQATRPPLPVRAKGHYHRRHQLVSKFHFYSFFFTSAASTATTTTAQRRRPPPSHTHVSTLYFRFSCFFTLIGVYPSICVRTQRIRVDLYAHAIRLHAITSTIIRRTTLSKFFFLFIFYFHYPHQHPSPSTSAPTHRQRSSTQSRPPAVLHPVSLFLLSFFFFTYR